MTTDYQKHHRQDARAPSPRSMPEPRIITTRRMITTGKRQAPNPEAATAFVIAAVTSLQSAAKKPLQLQPAPARGNVQGLLKKAGETANQFRTRTPQPPSAA